MSFTSASYEEKKCYQRIHSFSHEIKEIILENFLKFLIWVKLNQKG